MSSPLTPQTCVCLSPLSSEELECDPTSSKAPSPVSCSDPSASPEGTMQRPTMYFHATVLTLCVIPALLPQTLFLKSRKDIPHFSFPRKPAGHPQCSSLSFFQHHHGLLEVSETRLCSSPPKSCLLFSSLLTLLLGIIY